MAKYQPDALEVLAEGKFVRLVRRDRWEYVTRKGISGIVGVVGINTHGQLILVEQFRTPVGTRVIELPAGLAGDVAGSENEDLALAARRELLEETGYRADQMLLLSAGAASAGISDEIITLFLAKDLVKTASGGGDSGEHITVHEVMIDEVDQWLAEKRRAGVLIDLKVFAGLYLAGSYLL